MHPLKNTKINIFPNSKNVQKPIKIYFYSFVYSSLKKFEEADLKDVWKHASNAVYVQKMGSKASLRDMAIRLAFWHLSQNKILKSESFLLKRRRRKLGKNDDEHKFHVLWSVIVQSRKRHVSKK